MERFVTQALLYDFYGELLTENQRRVYEEVVLNDYSYTEVAENEGISRQSVHDMIKRCDRSLQEYERKLELVSKFKKVSELVDEIHKLSKEYALSKDDALVERIELLSQTISDVI